MAVVRRRLCATGSTLDVAKVSVPLLSITINALAVLAPPIPSMAPVLAGAPVDFPGAQLCANSWSSQALFDDNLHVAFFDVPL